MKDWLKPVKNLLNIQKMKLMASSAITSWQIDGGKVETVTDFIFLGSKITVDGDCSHEIKRCLLLGRKAMTNLDSILKSRDIPLLTKVCIVKAVSETVTVQESHCYGILTEKYFPHSVLTPDGFYQS